MLAKLDPAMTDQASKIAWTEDRSQTEHRKAWQLGPTISLWIIGLASLSLVGPIATDIPVQYLYSLATLVSALMLLTWDMQGWRGWRFLAGMSGLIVATALTPPMIWLHLQGVTTGSRFMAPAIIISLCVGLGLCGVFTATWLSVLRRITWRNGRPIVLNHPGGVLVIAALVTASAISAIFLVGEMTSIQIEVIWKYAGQASMAAALSLLVFQFSRHAFDPRGAFSRPHQVAAVAVGVAILIYGRHLNVTAYPVVHLLVVPVVCALYGLFRNPLIAWLGLVAIVMATPSLFVLIGTAPSEMSGPVYKVVPFVASVSLITVAMLNSRSSAVHDLLLTNRELSRMRASLARRGAGRLITADLGTKVIQAVDAEQDERPGLSFAEFFSGSGSKEMLQLFGAMNRASSEVFDRPFPLHLPADPFCKRRPEKAGEPVPCNVHILEKKGDIVWLAVISLASNAGLVRKADAAEDALAEVLVREERLLSVAAHEMRTPMSILSMLSEELDAGTPWSEVAASFRKANGRMTEILDDLRVRTDNEHVQILKTKYTLRELAFHLQETYTGPAQANGIALILALSQQSDCLIESDYGRVFIALSKLVHNAIIHSRGTEITLSAFLTRQSGGGAIITWQVSDDGRGISPERSKTVFRPFDTDGRSEGGDRTGLGLYTAQRAIRAMGGELSLRKTNEAGLVPRRLPPFSGAAKEEVEKQIVVGPGATFVLKHPARLAEHSKFATMEHEPVMETQVLYPNKTALLLEDNQIVGDITVARMRRLFGKSIWVERSDEALIAVEEHRPDLILVDQLLSGMLGSEFIRQIRASDKKVPIVGITASTMGTECAGLEAAGANFALEKPLSAQQLKKIAEEFFGGRMPESNASS